MKILKWGIVITMLAVFATAIIFSTQKLSGVVFSKDPSGKGINVSIDGINLREFDREGQLSYRLKTGKATWYPGRSLASFERLQLSIYREEEKEDSQSWEIDAEGAEIATQEGGNALIFQTSNLSLEQLLSTDTEIRLKGNVSLLAKRSGKTYIKFYGQDLTVHPKLKRLSTDQAISIEFKRMKTSAFGMDADLIEEHFVLFGDSRGQVETILYPKQRAKI